MLENIKKMILILKQKIPIFSALITNQEGFGFIFILISGLSVATGLSFYSMNQQSQINKELDRLEKQNDGERLASQLSLSLRMGNCSQALSAANRNNATLGTNKSSIETLDISLNTYNIISTASSGNLSLVVGQKYGNYTLDSLRINKCSNFRTDTTNNKLLSDCDFTLNMTRINDKAKSTFSVPIVLYYTLMSGPLDINTGTFRYDDNCVEKNSELSTTQLSCASKGGIFFYGTNECKVYVSTTGITAGYYTLSSLSNALVSKYNEIYTQNSGKFDSDIQVIRNRTCTLTGIPETLCRNYDLWKTCPAKITLDGQIMCRWSTNNSLSCPANWTLATFSLNTQTYYYYATSDTTYVTKYTTSTGCSDVAFASCPETSDVIRGHSFQRSLRSNDTVTKYNSCSQSSSNCPLDPCPSYYSKSCSETQWCNGCTQSGCNSDCSNCTTCNGSAKTAGQSCGCSCLTSTPSCYQPQLVDTTYTRSSPTQFSSNINEIGCIPQ